MSEETAISGTRRQYKEMADGTLRVQIDIDPQFKARFLEMFGSIDMPVALAPLVADFEKADHMPAKVHGGELSKLAAIWCQSERFWQWIESVAGYRVESEEAARAFVVTQCKINSRAELDHNTEAENFFHQRIRRPYSDFVIGRNLAGKP